MTKYTIDTLNRREKSKIMRKILLFQLNACCEFDHRVSIKMLESWFFLPHSIQSLDNNGLVFYVPFNIGIKHGFSCINIRQVPLEVLKTEAEGRGFQHLPKDLANVNALKNHFWSLLLHKNWKHLLHFMLFLALFCFTFSPMSREWNFHWLCSF